MKLMDQKVDIAGDDGLLSLQCLVGEGWVLEPTHTLMTGIVGSENVLNTIDILVPPLGVLLVVAITFPIGKA